MIVKNSAEELKSLDLLEELQIKKKVYLNLTIFREYLNVENQKSGLEAMRSGDELIKCILFLLQTD